MQLHRRAVLWIKGTYKSTARTAPWRIAGKTYLIPPLSKTKCWKLALFNFKNILYMQKDVTWSYRNSGTVKVISGTAFQFADQNWHFPPAVVVTNSLEVHTVSRNNKGWSFQSYHWGASTGLCPLPSYAVKNVWEQSSWKNELIILCCQVSSALCLTTTAAKWSYSPLQSLHFPRWWGTSHS